MNKKDLLEIMGLISEQDDDLDFGYETDPESEIERLRGFYDDDEGEDRDDDEKGMTILDPEQLAAYTQDVEGKGRLKEKERKSLKHKEDDEDDAAGEERARLSVDPGERMYSQMTSGPSIAEIEQSYGVNNDMAVEIFNDSYIDGEWQCKECESSADVVGAPKMVPSSKKDCYSFKCSGCGHDTWPTIDQIESENMQYCPECNGWCRAVEESPLTIKDIIEAVEKVVEGSAADLGIVGECRNEALRLLANNAQRVIARKYGFSDLRHDLIAFEKTVTHDSNVYHGAIFNILQQMRAKWSNVIEACSSSDPDKAFRLII